jgi:hypothetical protein
MEVTETSTLERDRLRAGRDAGLRLERPLAEFKIQRFSATSCVSSDGNGKLKRSTKSQPPKKRRMIETASKIAAMSGFLSKKRF